MGGKERKTDGGGIERGAEMYMYMYMYMYTCTCIHVHVHLHLHVHVHVHVHTCKYNTCKVKAVTL